MASAPLDQLLAAIEEHGQAASEGLLREVEERAAAAAAKAERAAAAAKAKRAAAAAKAERAAAQRAEAAEAKRAAAEQAAAKRAAAAAAAAAAERKRAAAEREEAERAAAESVAAERAAAVAAQRLAAEQVVEEQSRRLAAASSAAAELAQPVMTLADVGDITGRNNVPESSLGGETTCIVCFVNPKTHLAAPCGHQCACGPCAKLMQTCPYCRAPVQLWVQQRMV